MNLAIPVISAIISTISVTITEPVDGDTYEGDWLSLRVIVENENELPDSVHYSLNGGVTTMVPRLNTDWYTYMGNNYHTGYSESPAPIDNTILWTAEVTGDFHEFPTPVIVDGLVYYPQDSGGDSLFALDSTTGEVIWRYSVGSTDDAVTVSDGLLWISSDSLFCLNAQTGGRIWARGEADGGGGSPVLADGCVFAGRTEGFPDYTSFVSCFESSTGELLWTKMLSGGLVSCMTEYDGMLFVPTYAYQDSTCLYALDAGTGDLVWESDSIYEGFWDSSPVIVDDVLYICDTNGNALGIDPQTGDLIWINPLLQHEITATPAYHDNRLFFAPESGPYYYCIDAGSGSTIWSVDGHQHGSSGIAGGLVFYAECFDTVSPDTSKIIAMDLETGSEIWSYSVPCQSIQSSPAITDGIMYIAAPDWNLYAFGTGLKFTYLDDLYASIGANELIVTSWFNGMPVAADTINFNVTQTGIVLEPTGHLNLVVSPNPMQTSSSISFALDESGFVSVRIYDLSGRVVSTLVNQELLAGVSSFQWDGYGDDGELLCSGLYLCRIQYGGVVETTGLCLLR